MTSNRKEAFTLLEILLVVLVVGITVAAFLPAALNTVDQARTRSFLRQVISLNHYARSRAVLDRSPITIIYDLEEGWVGLREEAPADPEGSESHSFDDPAFNDLDPLDPPERKLLFKRTLPDTMRLRKVNGGTEQGDQVWIQVDVDGVSRSHVVEVVDPRGEIRTLRFNGFTGETQVDE